MTSCNNCRNEIQPHEKFCPNCGQPVQIAANMRADLIQSVVGQSNSESAKTSNIKTITSSGTYSGTMVKGEKGKGRKIFFGLLLIIVLSVVGYGIYWFKTDPDAGEKLTDALMGTAFMIVFFFFGWFFFRGKKRSGDSYDDDQFDHDDDDD